MQSSGESRTLLAALLVVLPSSAWVTTTEISATSAPAKKYAHFEFRITFFGRNLRTGGFDGPINAACPTDLVHN